MTNSTEDLAVQLKRLFIGIFSRNQKPLVLHFDRVREGGRLIALEFIYPVEWPDVYYAEMNTALLSLHHAGLIKYGANTVILNDMLLLDHADRI